MIRRTLLRVPEYLLAYFTVAAVAYGGEWVSIYLALRKNAKEDREEREKQAKNQC